MKENIKELLQPYPTLFDWARFLRVELNRMRLYGPRWWWMITGVELETDRVCTRDCPYCNRPDNDPKMFLSMEKIKDVLSQLSKLGYKGRLSFHSFNEPLTDKRLVEIIKYGHLILPSCEIIIYSNGDLLDEEKLLEMQEAGMNQLILTIHEPTKPDQEKMMLALARKYPELILLQDLRPSNPSRRLNNRGGTVKIGQTKHITRCHNILSLIIRASGKVVLCCHDGQEKYVVDNVYEKSILDILRNPMRLKRMIDLYYKKQFGCLPCCRACGMNI